MSSIEFIQRENMFQKCDLTGAIKLSIREIRFKKKNGVGTHVRKRITNIIIHVMRI